MATLIDADREYVRRRGLYGFAELAWPIVEGGPFVPGWHLEEAAAHLQAVSRKECLRLVINQPPGTTKSLMTSCFWNAWEWTERPTTTFIYASYDQSLVNRDGERVIKLLQSDWYQARWGRLLNPNSKYAVSDFANYAGGWRFSTSVAGKVTGRHADIQCVDDPIKPIDVQGTSRNAIERVSTWWRSTMASRMRDPKTGRRVVLMQRLDADDLAGECVAAGYHHLRLPMRYEADEPCRTAWGGDRRTEEGELLCPDRFPEATVRSLETEMGPDISSAQLQQRPSRKGGQIFRQEYWRYWHPSDPDMGVPPPDVGGLQIQSWDMAFKKLQDTDYVCGMVLWDWHGAIYLMHLINERLSFTESVQAVKDMSAQWPHTYNKLIEDKANGPAVEDQLKNELFGVTLVSPKGGKLGRAWAAQPILARPTGKPPRPGLYIPHPSVYPWVGPFKKQAESFPRAANDDMVDALTQGINALREHGDGFSEAMRKLREGPT